MSAFTGATLERWPAASAVAANASLVQLSCGSGASRLHKPCRRQEASAAAAVLTASDREVSDAHMPCRSDISVRPHGHASGQQLCCPSTCVVGYLSRLCSWQGVSSPAWASTLVAFVCSHRDLTALRAGLAHAVASDPQAQQPLACQVTHAPALRGCDVPGPDMPDSRAHAAEVNCSDPGVLLQHAQMQGCTTPCRSAWRAGNQ